MSYHHPPKLDKSRKSQYKYVTSVIMEGRQRWFIHVSGATKKQYDDERVAALAVDKILIQRGKPPVNILKPNNP